MNNEKFDIDALLSKNTNIDKEFLKKSRKLLSEIRKNGSKRKKSYIISPYTRRVSQARTREHRL